MLKDLVGTFSGRFDDISCEVTDKVTFKLVNQCLLGESVCKDGRKFTLTFMSMCDNILIFSYNYMNSSVQDGVCVFKLVSANELRGIFLVKDFEDLKSSCGNYILLRDK